MDLSSIPVIHIPNFSIENCKDPVTKVVEKYEIDVRTLAKIVDIAEPILRRYQEGFSVSEYHEYRFNWAMEPSVMSSMIEYTPTLSMKERAHLNSRIYCLTHSTSK